jgi:hypothetical protein
VRAAREFAGRGRVRLIDFEAANCGRLPCCGIQNCDHPGRREKLRWLQANARYGLRARTLMAPDGKPAGYIEYIPGEYAWRGVECPGYLFIHCIWVHTRRYQGKGWATAMLQACMDDALSAAKNGVAAVVRDGPWMADHRLFLANGFRGVDSAPPDYHLLARKIRQAAPDPSFRRDWNRKLARYSHGLTIIRSSQCPYIAKFAAEIEETAVKEYGLETRVVRLESHGDAQDAPTPYAVFSLIYNGRVLADHPVSRTRFRNIMKKLWA